ncbi:MAG: hypothetical protein KGL53_01005, partial [Elusimicrobia bacterium]|nr:hypothetical protein [Elusimicrobiota bacterium]
SACNKAVLAGRAFSPYPKSRMRYFVYSDERLEGPFTAEELRSRDGFGRATLVCPEEGLDETRARWRAAEEVPQLALALDERERARFSKSFLPPQPMVRDLPVLGSILDQVERIEGVVVGMRAELAQHEAEQQALTDAARAAVGRDDEIKEAARRLEARVAALEPLVEETEKLRSALKSAEQARAALASNLAALSSSLDVQSAKTAALEADMPPRLEEARRGAESLREELESARAETAGLKERLERADGSLAALGDELSALRGREDGRWRLGKYRLSPQGLLAAAAAALVLALSGLLVALLRKPPAPAPVLKPPPVVEVPPPPPPPAPKPKPRPKPRPKPHAKPKPTPAQAAVQARIRQTILLRATGGVISDKENVEAMNLVKAFTAPAPSAKACPRGLEDVVSGQGSRAGTPYEAASCWAWARFQDDVAAYAAAKKVSREAALAQLRTDAAEWGGLDRLLAVDSSAQRTSGQSFVVEIKASDLLAPKLAQRYGFGPAEAPSETLRYEADLGDGSVRPMTRASWAALDEQAAAKAPPDAKPPVFKRPSP